MSLRVCLCANTLHYPEGGGHFWVYLNWALGLRALGCEVIWLEDALRGRAAAEVVASVAAVKARLARYGLANAMALFCRAGERLPPGVAAACLPLEAVAGAELLLNLGVYDIPAEVLGRFRRSALVDIDPGQVQVWMSRGEIRVTPHDVYFTIGEGIGASGGRAPDVGLTWHHTPPCAALDWWPPHPAAPDAPFTTVSQWYNTAKTWMEDADGLYPNDKRSGFLPFLDLPSRTRQPLELALCLWEGDEEEPAALRRRGWRVCHAHAVASTPWDFQRYIQASRGEFSCAKPAYVRLQNAWISDRTVCYLASGKPAVVQHTGPSRFLPEAAGLFRVRDLDEAARALDTVAARYDEQCRLARALAEEFFDARKVVQRVLELATA